MTLDAGSGTRARPEKLQAAKLQSQEAVKPQSCTLRDSQSLATSFPKRQSEAPRSAKKPQEAPRSTKAYQILHDTAMRAVQRHFPMHEVVAFRETLGSCGLNARSKSVVDYIIFVVKDIQNTSNHQVQYNLVYYALSCYSLEYRTKLYILLSYII